MSDNKLFTDGTHTVDMVNGMDDLYRIAKEVWNAEPCDINIEYNEPHNYWEVITIDKHDHTYTVRGAINFDPNEDREQKSKA